MYILKSINTTDTEKIRNGNIELFKKKLEGEIQKWNELNLQTKEDHRYIQGITCTLLDIKDLFI